MSTDLRKQYRAAVRRAFILRLAETAFNWFIVVAAMAVITAIGMILEGI